MEITPAAQRGKELWHLHALLQGIDRRGTPQTERPMVFILRQGDAVARFIPIGPNECRKFGCKGYLLSPALGEHWLPSCSKLVVAAKPDGMEVIVHVDPGVPNARAEPYYSQPAAWPVRLRGTASHDFCPDRAEGHRGLPLNREVDLCVVAEDERIAIREEVAGTRRRFAVKLKVGRSPDRLMSIRIALARLDATAGKQGGRQHHRSARGPRPLD